MLHGAHTVGRCMPDAVPTDQGAWMQVRVRVRVRVRFRVRVRVGVGVGVSVKA